MTSTSVEVVFFEAKGESYKARIQKRNYTCYNLNYRNIGYIDPDTKESKEVKGELDFINKDALIMFLQNVWESYGKKYRACEYRLLRMHNDSYQCLFRIVEDKFDKDRFLKYLSAHDNLKSERVIDDLLILSVADFFLDGLPSSSEEEEEEIEQKEDAEVSPDN